MISTLITNPIIQVVERLAPSLEISKILAYISVLVVVGLKNKLVKSETPFWRT